jgi:rhodanese-related sulfurtransferase
LTAIEAARHDLVVVVACDLAWLDAATVRLLLAADPAAAVAMAHTDRPQPMCARWDRRRVMAPLTGAWATGERAIHRALHGVAVVRVPVSERALFNVNTLQDLAVASSAMPLPEITVAELATRLDGGAVLFDVRNPDEYDEAHVPGARLVPLPEVADRLDEFPTDTEVLVICRSGARSATASEFLRANGVDAVNVAGGTLAWIAEGRAVETGGAA